MYVMKSSERKPVTRLDPRRGVRHRWARRSALVVCAAMALGCAVIDVVGLPGVGVLTPSARADEPVKKAKKPKVDASAVYFGNASAFHKPAEVDTNAVWAEISEYKKILEDDLEAGSARYELLMEKASRRFSDAVRKAARSGGYDLVARSGSVENVADVPDITQDVIDLL
jgi:hypothetical protein